ncbi:Response regulator receiver sensor signal transduction histidine kinase [Candidatus Magnetomorum sp. HK-1]|nr:Response regulator receiver sensor signal transduction histidine kinase [Candidatus Magnetomorum sp. HK-1]
MNNKILVIDDESLNIQLYEDILSHENYAMETAFSGKEALEKLKHFSPDLILMDVMMPGMTGYEVCRRVREIPKHQFTKIIMISACTDIDERLQGYQAGADDYMTKPIEKEEFLAKINVFLKLKKAEEIDQLKSDLLTLFSHETKTPLNAIFGFSGLLKESPNLSDSEKQYVDNMVEAGNHLLSFVDKTILLCELKKDPNLERTAFYIEDQLQDILIHYQEKISKKNIEIRITRDSKTLMSVDWVLIAKMLEFLIDNAIKYSPQDGIINIIIETQNNICTIQIIDQGQGIPEEDLEFIFDPFAIKNIQNHQAGQGLSLSICRYIMDHHEGIISASNNPDGGACFTCELPISEK